MKKITDIKAVLAASKTNQNNLKNASRKSSENLETHKDEDSDFEVVFRECLDTPEEKS